MAKEIKISEGPYAGKYEVLECGKIIHLLWNSRGPVRNVVGRGTKRHKAVTAALD